jgi:nitrate/nitrite transporter NarK
MLSADAGSAFLARQAWGALADRIGGLRTVLAGSACQAVAIACFLLTQDEAGPVRRSRPRSGLGFAGIIPSYSVAIRDLFPAREASWRMPLTLFTAMSGMAFGSWFAGAPLRPLRLLRAGLRHQRGVQPAQPRDRRLPGVAHRRHRPHSGLANRAAVA